MNLRSLLAAESPRGSSRFRLHRPPRAGAGRPVGILECTVTKKAIVEFVTDTTKEGGATFVSAGAADRNV